jgi:hypothetical protein
MASLEDKSQPRRWGLQFAWRANRQTLWPTLILSVHEDLFPQLVRPEGTINALRERVWFRRFPWIDKGCGFGADTVIRYAGFRDHFFWFMAPLPRVLQETTHPCMYCAATGRDPATTSPAMCPACRGTKKEVSYDHAEAMKTAMSLTMFFQAAFLAREPVSTPLRQLFLLQSVTEYGPPHGRGLRFQGVYSPELVDWCYTHSSYQRLALPAQIMALVHRHFVGPASQSDIVPPEEKEFGVVISETSRWPYITMPGNKGISIPTHGREFASHGLENPHELLVLLCGLAKLHQMIDGSTD